jgi:hypothetical protein
MKIKLKFSELHNPLFLAGTNLQLKLDPTKRQGMTLIYDREEKELLVYWNNEVAIIPSSNVSSMTPVDPTILGTLPKAEVKPQPKPAPTGKPIRAQVQDPTRDVVFSNGPGKVRD